MIRKTAFSVGLLACALLWISGLSTLTDSPDVSSSVSASDGSTVRIKFIDKSRFYDEQSGEISLRLEIVDANDKPVLGLSVDELEIKEEDIPVGIKEFKGPGTQALNVVLVIDISGSMEEESRIEGARVAAVAALKELKLGRDRIGIVAFDDQVDIVQPLASLDSSVLEQCEFQINRLAPRGGTIIAPPTMAGLEMFANKSAKGSKILMVMTDGMDEQLVDPRMKTQLVDGLSESSDSQGAPVYTISFGSNEHPDAIAALRYIADRCSGKYYHAPSGAELAEIYRAQVQELEGAFTVTYNSPYPAADGLPRKVDVAVATPSGDVSAQSSYEIGPIIAGARRTAAPVTSAVSEGTEPAAGGSTFLKLMLFVVLLAALVGGLYASTVLPIFTQLSSGAATAAAGPTPPGPATGTPSSSTTPPPPPPPTGVPSRSQQQPAAKPPAAQSSASPKPVTKPASPSKPPPPPPPPGGRPKRQ